MNRRGWLATGTVAVVAAGAGLGWSAWQRRAGEAMTAPAPGPGEAGAQADGSALWTSRFTRPEGGELVMAEWRGRPFVLNFWATWCPPCVKEMPQLDRFHQARAQHGWAVVGLAIDGPTPVREFLRRTPVSFPIGLAGLDGTDLVRQLGNPGAALPFSVVFGREGVPLHRKLGETSFDELAGWARELR